MFDAILLPTDGSQEMESVVARGIELAALCGATIHTVHVVDERAYLTVPDDARDQVQHALEEDAKMAVRAVSDVAADAGVEVAESIRWGDPSASILSYAVDNDIDLIVMGTHGRTGYERYLLGSVAEKVMRVSPMPVLTISVGDTEETMEKIKEYLGEDASGAAPPNNLDADPLSEINDSP